MKYEHEHNRKHYTIFLLALGVALLTGCGATTSFTAPFTSSNKMGQTKIEVPVCMEKGCPIATYYGTKNISTVEFTYARDAETGDIALKFDETGVDASTPLAQAMEIMKANAESSQALTKLATTIIGGVAP